MKAFFLTLLLQFAFAGHAQQLSAVSGRVVDGKGLAVPFASVVLRLLADSAVVQAMQASDAGRYQLANVPVGRYWVEASAVGYGNGRSSVLQVVDRTLVVPDIQLAATPQLLREVQVVGQKPLLEMTAGKLVVNVAGSLTAGSTALEVLEKVPGLLVLNNRISLAGQEGVLIQIDGRTTQYTDVVGVLKDFPSSTIERIEVLTQPGATHDATGAVGIINIILKKNTDLGTNGTLTTSGAYGRFAKAGALLDLNHRAGALNIFGTASYNQRQTYEQLNTERLDTKSGIRYRQQSYQPRLTHVPTVRLGADYSLSHRQTLGVLLNGYTNRTQLNAQSSTLASNGVDVFTANNTSRTTDSYAGNLNYKVLLDTLGCELTADVDYSRYATTSLGLLTNTVQLGDIEEQQVLRNNQQTRIQLASAKVDYRHPVGANTKLLLGAKISEARIWSVLDLTGGDAGRPDRFRYTESIRAGYVQGEGTQLGVTWQAGLRGEYTAAVGTAATSIRRAYGQLFPSISIDKPVTKALGATMAYSRRIGRPSYQDLNPNLVYLDPYTSQRGTPLLRPQFTGSYKLSVTYQKQPFLVLGYSRTRNAISLVTATEDSAIYSTSANLDNLRSYNATLNLPITYRKLLTGYAGVTVFYNEYLSEYLGSTYRAGRTAATFYGQANVQLPQTIKLEASGFYQTAGLNGLIRFRGFGALNVGLQKTLWQDRATLRLGVNDVLFSNRQRGTVRYQDLDVQFQSFSESRQVRLSVSWKLGNQQLKAARKRMTGLEEERARVKTDKE
ncbi:outer membrane beta-barrel protein [Hymenobacter puniceus]|uniref:outer membrane beta-barrel protein n=1 Tax=Hymenobacter sp. BT190 TaxID=2763505 RepID=UPI001650E563|nr:outer membrane beta-barrel protein [Hymenobacter sp. BT190]MBC6697015.1 outer membrane beta-barrel protein [Hymenobacter sp. BT190]